MFVLLFVFACVKKEKENVCLKTGRMFANAPPIFRACASGDTDAVRAEAAADAARVAAGLNYKKYCST